MKKTVLLFLLSLTLYSCEVQYNGYSRLIVEGTLKDKDGNPIVGKYVETQVDNGFDTNVISDTQTDNQGNFLMVFPEPSNDDAEIRIKIPPSISQQSRTYILSKNNFSDYKFTLPSTPLYSIDDRAYFQIFLNAQNSGSNEIRNLRVLGNQFEEIVDYTTITDENVLTLNYVFLKDQLIEVKYEIYFYSSGTSTEYSEIVSIGSGNEYNYTISY